MTSSIPLVDDLIYDVGMHKGEDTAYYLAKGYRVVAFEANGDLVAHCRERFSTEIAQGRLRLIEGAITDSGQSTVRFYKHPLSAWGTTQDELLDRNLMVAPSEAVDVPAVDFGRVLRETGMPCFMKIDIEGSDMVCLRALLEFDPRPRWLSIESDKIKWSGIEEEFAMLDRLGYDRFAVVQQGTIPGSEIKTQTLDGRWFTFRFEEDSSGAFGPDVGPWMNRGAAIWRYRRVFLGYRLLGGESLLRRTRVGRMIHGAAIRRMDRPIPGWFDTHATREEPARPSP